MSAKKIMANYVAGSSNVDVNPSAVASVVAGVLNAMGFQQNGGTGDGDTPGGSRSGGTSGSTSRYRKLVIANAWVSCS